MEISDVLLVKNEEEKCFPIVYAKQLNNLYYCFKIRNVRENEIEQLYKREKKKKSNKGALNEKFKNYFIFNDFKNPAIKKTIIYKQLYTFNPEKVIKLLGTLNKKLVEDSLDAFYSYKQAQQLHTELHSIKRKINYAQLNNEKYSHLEKRESEILSKLGYGNTGEQSAHSIGTRRSNLKVKHRGYNKSFYSGR